MVTVSGRGRGLAALVVLLLAAAPWGVSATATAAADCASVRRVGAWTAGPAPTFSDAEVNGVAVNAGALLHILGFPGRLYAPGGAPGRAFVSDGVSIGRTSDGGCTWTRVYSIGPAAAGAATADPAVLAAMGLVQYKIAALAAFPRPPGRAGPGPDTVIAVLTNGDGFFTGLGPNLAGGTPFLVARSVDGGVTWTTDLMRRSAPGAPAPVPVLGDGTVRVDLAVSPVDPRLAYLTSGARSGDSARAAAETAGRLASLYVTRDGGLTWQYLTDSGTRGLSFNATAADPVDASVLYRIIESERTVEVVTASATPSRRTLLTLPAGTTPTGIDVLRRPGRAAEIVVTSQYRDNALNRTLNVLHRTVDGGRSWTPLPVPTGAAAVGTFVVGSAARIVASGDVVVLRQEDSFVLLRRWDARRQAWRRPEAVSASLAAGYAVIDADGFVPVDATHRQFGYLGWQSRPGIGRVQVVGEFDSDRAP